MPTCTDSDSGQNFDIKGTTSNTAGETLTDSCVTGNSYYNLVEGFCGPSGKILKYSYLCPEGCSNGACSYSQVSPGPDLVIDNIELSVQPYGYEYRPSSIFKITVKNIGTLPAPASILSYSYPFDYDWTLLHVKLNVPSLNPGESQIISGISYTGVGDYNFFAKVDSENQVAETNEYNNVKMFEVTVYSSTSGSIFICGDSSCNGNETCSSCASDCGVC